MIASGPRGPRDRETVSRVGHGKREDAETVEAVGHPRGRAPSGSLGLAPGRDTGP